MSESRLPPAGPSGETAGSLLRQARQAQGLHIAALAAMIKVTPRKLEALEADRYDELPDATFTRALAQAVCRALKIDAGPVLSRLPATSGQGLESVGGSINRPLRTRGMSAESGDGLRLNRSALLAVGLLVAAAVIYFLPANLMPTPWGSSPEAASAPVLPAGVASEAVPVSPAVPLPTPAPASTPVPAQPTASANVSGSTASAAPVSAQAAPADTAPPAAPAALAPSTSQAPGAASLRIAARGASWVEVQDASGKMLLSRTVQPGEALTLDGALPLRVKVGNAAVTELSFRGQPVRLDTRDNVARLELQ